MVTEAALARIAEEVRREQAPVPRSVASCQFLTDLLARRLQAAGWQASAIAGYFVRAEAVASRTLTAESRGPWSRWDGVWNHWWVECEGFVVDVTADQVESGAPAIVVMPKACAVAYRERPPTFERRHSAPGHFQQ